ncbi:MAG: 2-hydroxychromene-2-carboxylate isomerase [Proteobacteria bacterium]|nr:2-hydroxychromene-2-carboxylate isomerase [Pseudomonadota bacterium]MDA1357518.1 2-hydroxychromene-2-carboxylate isomerase [Pseudomonadota bacterium]
MTKAVWYFDFISPFAYLQWQDMDRLPNSLEISYRPVLFAGLLNHWGHLGPAEIPAKRRHTYRYCHWLAGQRNIPFKLPPVHPFNPLKALRLAVALGEDSAAINEIFNFIYAEGGDVEGADGWRRLTTQLGLADGDAQITASEIKQALKDNTDEALAAGVFGVPTFVADGEIFWGQDGTGMFLDWLKDPAGFATGEFARIANLPYGAQRARR